MMGKRGQSNMFWIIIAAVIALVVMIVLLLLFTGKTNMLEKGVSGCEGKGGECVETDCKDTPGTLEAPFDCANEGENYVCCIGFGNTEGS